ncbi:GDP-mannose 4,6-dehydratase [Paenibacillus sp. UNC451MF]|uniref:GDP-mannose 4,6-dehydratase n=1 Tax=Paenibacillus sp. UNC451MF TaxID=1449063 RepID=UPI000491FFB4|nr:GDP-mannose 4,6-dehydratase [Paenibacillus sp. UNC451MF]
MNVSLITGINGFVGKHLGRLLMHNGHTVYGTSRNSIQESNDYSDYQLQVSFDNKDEIKKALNIIKPNFIFHLMAQSNVPDSWKHPEETYYTNVIKTINLLDSIVELNIPVRIINIGSSEEYGFNRDWDMPIKEDYELYPQNPYGESKATISKLIKQYVDKYGLDIIHMRPFNHIGPGQRPGFVVPDFSYQIIQIEKGLKNPILKVGNLTSKRDFTDVRDIVRAYLLAAKKGKTGEVYNVCSGVPVGIITILEKLITLSTVDVKYEVDEKLYRPNDIPLYYGDNSKIFQDIQWQMERSIDTTLSDTMNFLRNSFK